MDTTDTTKLEKSQETPSVDVLVEKSGGCGKYQIFIVFSTLTGKFFIVWAMLMMSFGNMEPDWHCLDPELQNSGNFSAASSLSNHTYKSCSRNCTVMFQGGVRTIVTEFGLVCDKQWIPAAIISVQMSGVLVGAALAGFLGDSIGRKKTLFGSNFLCCVFSVVAIFSVNWEMFAAVRALIGATIGSHLAVVFPYPMEFVPRTHRSLLCAIPTWNLGTAAFAILVWTLKDWRYIHVATAITMGLCSIGYFTIPESIRWLTVKGRITEAEGVVRSMARMNGRPAANASVLQDIYDQEQLTSRHRRAYTYVDLFRSRNLIKTTLLCCYVWFSLGVCYYGISFGVKSLPGNFYTNLILSSVLEIPPTLSLGILTNKFGRRWTCFGYCIVSVVSCAAVVVVFFTVEDEESRGKVITGLALVAKMSCITMWNAFNLFSAEVFPTVVRNLGFGAANTAARVGGIIAPFVLATHPEQMYIAFVAMGFLLCLVAVSCLMMEETQGAGLKDTIQEMEIGEEMVPKENKR